MPEVAKSQTQLSPAVIRRRQEHQAHVPEAAPVAVPHAQFAGTAPGTMGQWGLSLGFQPSLKRSRLTALGRDSTCEKKPLTPSQSKEESSSLTARPSAAGSCTPAQCTGRKRGLRGEPAEARRAI